MTRWVVQLRLEEAAVLDGLPGSAGRHLPGSVGEGDATWDVVSATVPETSADGVRVVDTVALAPLVGVHVPFAGPRIKRTLLVRVRPGTSADAQAQFEAELAAMARYIDTIRSWALSRVDQDLARCRWTHVWEQEYESVAGLRGEYMTNPYHWAGVDRWFDGEMPTAIVEPSLAHVFYEARGPVLP
jgi:hypothetical protein